MGREFLDLFEDWADSYDDTVAGKDAEYKDVFAKYEEILEGVVSLSSGTVVEFGPGTGNLTAKLSAAGLNVIPFEPSPEMRVIGQQKLGDRVPFFDGDFLDFKLDGNVDTIVSTYAFHHLTDEEKGKAFGIYGKLLAQGGKIVFADTMFETEQHYRAAIDQAMDKGYLNLAEDLKREYYTTLAALEELASAEGFTVHFRQINNFVWIMEATKQ
ncbi:class I SAM-dependent methyltransferase [Mangrovibacillus sp. Mu-81]|jgi:putative AdoMet-dependent methyltransferase|uniref:class I SAM-dependent DNA methyltransferase n=1 Tax=Mangrovibacillus sp. Mu-81 TaxID=3121478 RepID=UPI002FE49CED